MQRLIKDTAELLDHLGCKSVHHTSTVRQFWNRPFLRHSNGDSFGVPGTHAMRFPRRQFLHPAAGAVALPAISRIATAQTYPSRTVTMIVPFAAGGPTDVSARIVAEHMSRTLGQQIIIENVLGAG